MSEPAGVDYLRAFPGETLVLAGRKLLYSFGVLRDGWNVPHPAAVWIWRATTGAIPLSVIEPTVRGGWLLVASAIGLFMLGRDGVRTWMVLPLSIGAILAVHVITLASYRFSVPLLPVLYVLASGPATALARAAAPLVRVPVVAVGCALIAVLAVAAQFQSWPLAVQYRAADLDGLTAANRVDEVTGAPARFADAGPGARPVVLLPDTYLPRGPLLLEVAMRQTGSNSANATAAARVALVHLDGTPACVENVPAAQLPHDRFADIAVSCRLTHDGPATLAVYSTGQTDLAIDRVRLTWTR
jgi:hypothetical protein